MRSISGCRIVAGAAGLLLCSITASAQDQIPDLRGTWSGKIVGGFRAGELEHSGAEKAPKSAVGLERTLVIQHQEGSGFTGAWGSNTKDEPIIGVIRADGRTILMVDDDTNFMGMLQAPNSMEVCVQEHGAARIAVCALLTKN